MRWTVSSSCRSTDAPGLLALINYLTDNNPGASVDLHDEDTVQRKLRGLFGLLLQSPAFQLQ